MIFLIYIIQDLTNLILFSGRPPNITLRVITRIEQPFVMMRKQKEPDEVLEGNDRFEVQIILKVF